MPDFGDIIDRVFSDQDILPADVPQLDLYMDQVLSLFDQHLSADKRNPSDKLLTKTMVNNYVKEHGEIIPPLIHSYIELSPSMKTFGTCLDKDFGDVYDTAMMITIADVYPAKIERYVKSFKPIEK